MYAMIKIRGKIRHSLTANARPDIFEKRASDILTSNEEGFN